MTPDERDLPTQSHWAPYQEDRSVAKQPHTLQEAFGPYTDSNLQEQERKLDWQDRLVLAASVVAAVACFAIITLWG